MTSLLIDTCTNNVIIGLLENLKLIDKVVQANDKNLSTNFVMMIDELLKKNSLDIKSIDTIFVAVGPGSFTGIRVGVTFAKVMAWTLQKKVIPFSSLELMATTDINTKLIVPLIDARRGYVFAGIYDQSLNRKIDDAYISLDDLMHYTSKFDDISYVSNDIFYFQTLPTDYNIEKLVQKHINDDGVNPHKLNPVYLKRTEAEEKLNN